MPPSDDDEENTAPVSHAARPWVTLKYGGTSVSFEKTWRSIANRIKELLPKYRVVLVLSALSQVSLTHAKPSTLAAPPATVALRHLPLWGGDAVVAALEAEARNRLLAVGRWVEGGASALYGMGVVVRLHAGAALPLCPTSYRRMTHILGAFHRPTEHNNLIWKHRASPTGLIPGHSRRISSQPPRRARTRRFWNPPQPPTSRPLQLTGS